MIVSEKPLVSVLIAAFNHENYVEKAIMSVINQTYGYENIQLIITDDCSSDNTPVILQELTSKYDFELLLHHQNIGVCSTLNEMILLSKGKYISGFASDDIMVLDRIENQIDILKKNPEIDILAGEAILIDKSGEVLLGNSKPLQSSLTKYNFDDFFLRLKPGFAAGTVIIKSKLFQRVGTYDPNYKIEDYYFWLKAAYNEAKIVKCNQQYLYYRVQQNSLSSNREFVHQEIAKILSIYKSDPKYNKAKVNHELNRISELIFVNKISVLRHLFKKPVLIFNKKTIIILVMLIIPRFVLKRKFPQNYLRNAGN